MPSSKDKKKERERERMPKSSSKRDSASSSGKEKKKKSSSKDKSKSPSRSKKRSQEDDEVAEAPEASAQQHASPAPPPPEPDQKASLDFEAGLLFQRFARNGGVDAKSFQLMWRERDSTRAGMQTGEGQSDDQRTGNGGTEADRVFEFGQLFQKFDTDGDGRLGRAEFERMIGEMLEGLGRAKNDEKKMHPADSDEGRKLGGEGADKASADSGRVENASTEPVINISTLPGAPAPVAAFAHPSPLLGGGVITHYDETSGVPLSREVVASQKALGHTVVQLNEAYNRRLSRLQTLLSSRLMPVREQLLQLRRRYHTRADEVKGAKAAIERETTADGGAILERLRSAESLKQAALAQGVNDISAELEGVERIADQVSRLAAPASTPGFAFGPTRYTHDFGSTEKMVELIQSYPELCGSIDGAASKPFDNTVDVRVDDLPHETTERLEVLRRADRYERALGIKEHMLWTLIQESHVLGERCRQERDLGQEFAEEAQEWVALAGRLSDDVKGLRKKVEEIKQLREENAALARENRDLLRRLEALEGGRLTSDG